MTRDRNQQCLVRFSAIASMLVLLLPGDSFAFRPSSSNSGANKMRTPTQTPPIEGDTRFDARDALNIRVLPRAESKPPVVDVDLGKARDLARHFGKYTYKEIQHMRDDLKEHRFRNDSPSDVLFLERLFEDELTSQLQALKDDMPEPYLFRDDPPTRGLFGNERRTARGAATIPAAETTKAPKGGFDIVERLLDEGVLEYLVICIIVGLVMLARE